MRPGKGPHGSSNQLFVMLADEEAGLSGQTDEAQAEDSSKDLALGAPGMPTGGLRGGKGLKALALTAGAALVCCAVLTAYGGAMRRSSQEGPGSGLVGKSSVIGSQKVPEDLDSAPEPEHFMIGHPGYHCTYATTERCPASELFFNSDVFEVATENLMQVGRGIFKPRDRDLVRDTVAAGFRNISKQIEEHADASLEALQHIQLDIQERNSVLTWLRLMSCPEVQSIGYEVAMAVRRSMSSDPAVVRSAVEEILSTNLDNVKALRDELIAPAMLEYWGPEQQWELTLDPENIAVMQAFRHGEFYGSLDADFYSKNVSGLIKQLPVEEKAYGAWGGVLEQGRALIDIVRLLSRRQSIELLVPRQATSLDVNVDVKDLGSELLSCELQPKDGMNNLMKALFCPLKYGSQGMDALRAVHHMEHDAATPA